MKKKASILIILFGLFCAVNVFAESPIKAEIDKASITTDEIITYKLTITAAEKNIPAPQLPEFKGFNVISQSQSSKISLARGNIKSTLIYIYILAPQDTGRFNIEPASIKIRSKIYTSEPFEIEVKQGRGKPQKIQPETEEPQITL